MGRIRSVLHVDTLDVSSSDNGSGQQMVRGGKYLNPNVYVEVQKGVNDQSGNTRVEVEIAPNVSVQAETGANAQGGVGIPMALRLLSRDRRPGPPALSTFGTPFDLNLIGLGTLYLKEVRRFLKVPGQTLAAPVVTTLMFLLIFSLALGRSGRTVGTVPFLEFLAPGLIMTAIIQNAFANTSATIMIGKIQGNIVDILMPPLRPGELLFGLIAGGVTRGILVAVAVTLAMVPFIALAPAHPLLIAYYALAGSLMLALLGLLGGIWAKKSTRWRRSPTS